MENQKPKKSLIYLNNEEVKSLRNMQDLFLQQYGFKPTYSQAVSLLVKFWIENKKD
tara:strand:+ start:202 stop:369 length:168 start_codon:yes stop_codon:yes gene_type:complete